MVTSSRVWLLGAEVFHFPDADGKRVRTSRAIMTIGRDLVRQWQLMYALIDVTEVSRSQCQRLGKFHFFFVFFFYHLTLHIRRQIGQLLFFLQTSPFRKSYYMRITGTGVASNMPLLAYSLPLRGHLSRFKPVLMHVIDSILGGNFNWQ